MRLGRSRADCARVQSWQGTPAAASTAAPCLLHLDGWDGGSGGGSGQWSAGSVEGGSCWGGRAGVRQRERVGAFDGEAHGDGPSGRICRAGVILQEAQQWPPALFQLADVLFFKPIAHNKTTILSPVGMKRHYAACGERRGCSSFKPSLCRQSL